MLTNIITTYLQTHKRIVVPQLGAFLMKQPEGYTLFTELMKRDDGVLRELVCAEGHSEIEAMGIIDRFVFETRHAVLSKGSCYLPGLGNLIAGPQGSIRFEYGPQTSEVAQGDAEQSSQEIQEPQTETAEIQQPEIATEDATPEKNDAEVATVVPQSESPVAESTDESNAVGRSIGNNPHVSNSAKMNPEPYVRGLRYSKPAKNTNAYSYVERGSTRRKFDWILLFAIFALAVVGGVLAFVWWNERKAEQAREEIEQIQTAQPIETQPEIPTVES